MDTSILIILIVIVLALAFDFINGFHDTANAIATAVSTRALKPRTAIMMAAVMNFLGAMMFTGVAKTIGGSVANPADLDNGLQVLIATLIAAIIWNLATWWFGIPSSSSHRIFAHIDDQSGRCRLPPPRPRRPPPLSAGSPPPCPPSQFHPGAGQPRVCRHRLHCPPSPLAGPGPGRAGTAPGPAFPEA